MKKIIIWLFTFSSMYSANASGAEQMPATDNQIELDRVKNPNWSEANHGQFVIYKRGREFELGTIL